MKPKLRLIPGGLTDADHVRRLVLYGDDIDPEPHEELRHGHLRVVPTVDEPRPGPQRCGAPRTSGGFCWRHVHAGTQCPWHA